ncbi:MAG TPA: aminodeoxychorismate synthase component I [Armatimonadota bacterium]
MQQTYPDIAEINEPPRPGEVVLQQTEPSGAVCWWRYRSPRAVIRATRVSEVVEALAAVEREVARGYSAAGFLAYEAAPAFDHVLVTHAPGALPLLWFGIYERGERLGPLPLPAGGGTPLTWIPSIAEDDYRAAIRQIKDYIAAGDTYQVNYTLRLQAPFAGDPWALFLALTRAQRGRVGAYVDLGDHVLCSASPELFFRLEGTHIACSPMKGTVARGLTAEEDQERARWLAGSGKNRAENVIIVDMMRSDLGRIARPGSVEVARLFAVEQYATLYQLVSTVTAQTEASLSDILAALYPCASITGAPKVRTMQIIREQETTPRGIYTGCIGSILPGRRAQFNVAIRTVHVNRSAGQAEYGTGGGIVWDSSAESEYAESQTKALVLLASRPPFSLLETLRWRPGAGYNLLDYHLRRLAASARYFSYVVDPEEITQRLEALEDTFPPTGDQRVRLLLAENGKITLEAFPLTLNAAQRWRVALAKEPIDPADPFLYHKTTNRQVYETARAAHPGLDDVILWNPRGEATESTIANLVIRRGDRFVTPPVSCGLLPGTYRAALLEAGDILEEVITLDDLLQSDAAYLINSVRGWIPLACIIHNNFE